MQLSMQCTWISLNLTRIGNQARRWMEEVFSSSKYASSIRMCKREPPKVGHLLFISSLNKRVVGHFHWAEVVHTGCVQYEPGQRLVLVTIWKTTVAANWDTAPDSQLEHTGRVWSRPDASGLDRTQTQRALQTDTCTGLTHQMPYPHRTKTQRVLRTELALDAHTGRVRSSSGCVRCIPDANSKKIQWQQTHRTLYTRLSGCTVPGSGAS